MIGEFNNFILKTVAILGVVGGLAPQLVHAKDGAFPEEAGKQLAQKYCSSCHQLNRITSSSGYNQADWKELIGTMVELSSDSELTTLSKYLAEHFPLNDKHSPQLVSGEHSIGFKEWVVPTLGQRSRDPIQSADGTIWWVGQWGNLIGKINPDTGEMKEYALPTGSMPHSVTLDNAGGVWYTGNKNASVGKLNPETGEVTRYDMPDPAAKDPHTAIFDQHGTMFFTLQHSNKLGRLNPESGDIKLVDMPTADSRPYGIKLDQHGNPWVACNGSNCLVKVDPKTMALKEYKLPGEQTKVRRLDFDSHDMIWYVNSSLGKLGRFDPKTGEVKQWDSPSGPKSHPYAIAVIDDIVWYNESGMRPDPLVRFDPKTESFQSWAIPSGGFYAGIIRHMRPTEEGNLLIHQSSTNRIILVELP